MFVSVSLCDQNVQRVLRELQSSCLLPDGSDDPTKATYLMEVYALDIQLCTLTKNSARMKVHDTHNQRDIGVKHVLSRLSVVMLGWLILYVCVCVNVWVCGVSRRCTPRR
jgi:hypothetical protein